MADGKWRISTWWIAAEIGGCANCLEIGDDVKLIIKRLKELEQKLFKIVREN